MAVLGHSDSSIKSLGRWKSVAFEGYIRLGDDDHRRIFRSMSRAGPLRSLVPGSSSRNHLAVLSRPVDSFGLSDFESLMRTMKARLSLRQ